MALQLNLLDTIIKNGLIDEHLICDVRKYLKFGNQSDNFESHIPVLQIRAFIKVKNCVSFTWQA